MPRNRAKIGVVALALIVLAGVVLWIVLSPYSSPSLPEMRANGTNATKEAPACEAPSPTITDPAEGRERPQPEENHRSSDQVSASDKPENPEQTDPPPDIEPGHGRVTIFVVDGAGRPFVGLLVSYGVFPGRSGEPTPVRVTRDSLSQSAQTDGRGAITLTRRSRSFVVVAAPDGRTFLPERGHEREADAAEQSFRGGGYDLGHGAGSMRVFKVYSGRNATHTVRCLALSTMPVRVRYDDGRPGEGTLEFSQWTDRKGEPPGIMVFGGRDLELDVNGEVQVPYLPEVGHLGVGVFCNRPGWSREVRLRKDVAGLDEFEVVIPAEKGVGYLTLNVSGLEPGESVRIEVRSPVGFGNGQFDGVGNGSYVSRRIPFGGKVRVLVSGDRAWVSSEIEINEAEMEIDVLPAVPSTVTLRPVDSAGEPVLAAALLRDVWGNVPGARPLRFTQVRSERVYTEGEFATADEAGQIRYEGLAAGEHSLLLLARGYEARVVHYTVAPGRTADLGDVALRKYVGDEGVVRVSLVGTADFDDFRCGVDAYLGPGSVDNVRPDERGRAEFRDLFYRRSYMFTVRRVSDGARWYKIIELSPGEPTADVEFDVSKPQKR